MHPKFKIIFPFLVGSALFLSACEGGGFRQASSWPGLSSDENNVYLAFGEAVYALSAERGTVRWVYRGEAESGRTFYAPVAASEDGLLIVGDFNNSITALKASSCDKAWGPVLLGDESGRIVGSPTIVGDLVLVASGDGRLYARDLADGSAVWTYPAEFDEPLKEPIWSSPVVDSGRVFITSLDHNVYAVDLETGGELWSTSRDLGGAIADSPVLADGLVITGTFGNQLVALDKERGRERWTFDAGHWIWGGPAIGEGVAYVGDLSGKLHAIDVTNGRERWQWSESIPGRISASPAYSNGRLFVVSESGTLYAFEVETERPLWQITLDGELHTDPLVVGDKVYVATNGGEPLLSVFNTETGNLSWPFTPGDSDPRCGGQ